MKAPIIRSNTTTTEGVRVLSVRIEGDTTKGVTALDLAKSYRDSTPAVRRKIREAACVVGYAAAIDLCG